MLSKDDEYQILDKIIAGLPKDSYLHDIFTYERAAIIDAIKSDICFLDIRHQLTENARQLTNAKNDLKNVINEELEVRRQMLQMQQKVERAKQELVEIQTSALRITQVR